MRFLMLGACAFLLLSGCNRSNHVRSPGGKSNDVSTTYNVRATQIGQALYLELSGARKAMPRERSFEDPNQWTIQVSAAGNMLKKVTLGSVRVEREEVFGTNLFDTKMKLSMGFAMPQATTTIMVHIKEPNGTSEKQRIKVQQDRSRVAGR